MRNATIALGVLLLVTFAVPALAQGPFADVPTDHWAYQAVNDLQQKGVLLGYPDGTFGGKRAITRYEFAVAIARMIPIIVGMVPTSAKGVTQADLDALKNRVTALENKPGAPGGVSQADLDTLKRLMDQFKDELAALGVDVDALKRDVANLAERVTALEGKVGTVTWSGALNTFGIATKIVTNVAVDRDNRIFAAGATQDEFANTIGVIYDADLSLSARLSETATANAIWNMGNYLTYIGVADDYISGVRRTQGSGQELFFPCYIYVDTAVSGGGSLQAGRLPLQFTPYTLKRIDVDSYTNNCMTDSGDYPVDGAKLAWKFGNVQVIGFAGKSNSNSALANGMTSQPTGGLYATIGATDTPGKSVFNLVGGPAAGGLVSIDQSAGIRAMIGTPYKGNLGLTFIRVAGPPTGAGINTFDRANIMGADLNFQYSNYNVGFEFGMTNTLNAGSGSDIDELNKAFDGKVGFDVAGVGLDVGFKSIERGFTAPGAWDKIGRWTNPTNIQGPYLGVKYDVSPSVKLNAGGAFYKGVNTIPAPSVINEEDDDLWQATAGLKWGFAPMWSADLGLEYVRWEPNNGSSSSEQYWTVGATYQINPTSGLKLAYQVVDYSAASSGATPYGSTDYKGNLALAEFGVKF